MSIDTQAHNIEEATVQISPVTQGPPDAKTRRYDRQLRLWAASGQNALEGARVLVLGGTATTTSILKNLVLPGIGHFTILDSAKVTPEDAGNNFFLEGQSSIGKSRAKEAVRLLLELNDSVEGVADESDLEEILKKRPEYFATFSLVIAHNVEPQQLAQLSSLLWADASLPPLVVVRSAGFLAEFYIQFHEHTIIDTHSETMPSLRIDKPFPALLEHAMSLDFANMDLVEFEHVPYVVILVRVLEEWKKAHGGQAPKTADERKAFKQQIAGMQRKHDEENFEEAEAQAYRAWATTSVPSDVAALFADPGLIGLKPDSPPFFHLLDALKRFTERPPHVLPLSATLPDMKSDTKQYVHLQRLYKARAEEEKEEFKKLLGVQIHDGLVSEFVKNAHGIKILRGRRWGALDEEEGDLANALQNGPREACTHLALSALSAHFAKAPGTKPTLEQLQAEAYTIAGKGFQAPEELEHALGELVRAPTADIPTTAAFLGGLVAQEAIKVITTQYVPINGSCVVDLVGSWTGIVN
ncbi:hypothetical protein EXIGLDRAFT_842890 [Exidia glandulosa HHB12029]|uniref:NEDD8-activating enzyme E1 regulatory subunit n=1 Tax=Exidia glandulosa HHB12029 TaxID=1314781 RepID=A0A165CZT9_EXIGL|nr:hypothetical protein EXIGLDRAFT_842890 [Exidia glandulosa HHB12029]